MNISQMMRLLLAFAVALLSMADSFSHAQVTRNWIPPNGGVFDIPTNWTPLGNPGLLDTARFNSTNSNSIPILYFVDSNVAEIDVADGTFVFRGTGTQGSTLRDMTTNELNVESDSQLWLQHGFEERDMQLTVNDSSVISGQLQIIEGSLLRTPSNEMEVDSNTTMARLRIAGANPNGDVARWFGQDADIGNTGSGELIIEEGARAEVHDMIVGRENGSLGKIVIAGSSPDGIRSTLNMTGFMIAGRFGESDIEVRDGGQFYIDTINMGPFASSTSSILVTGRQASGNPTHFDSNLIRISSGTANVEDGALVTSAQTYFDGGEVNVTGQNTHWFVSENLDVGGENGFNINVQDGARFSSEGATNIAPESGLIANILISGNSHDYPGRFLSPGDVNVGGDSNQAGGDATIELMSHGWLNVDGTLKIWDDGIVNMNNFSRIVADRIEHTDGGQFNFQGGQLQVNQFEGELEQTGGSFVPAGNEVGSTIILGDYSFNQGKLVFNVGGTTAGVEHDLVNMSGTAFVNGQLVVLLNAGYMPSSNDTFTVMVANNLLGFFNNVFNGQRMDTADGNGSFIVNYGVGSAFDENRVVLSEFEPNFIVGDVNGDGVVDLLDVAPFVDAIISGVYQPAADINQDGSIDLLDVQPLVAILAGS